MAHLVCGPICQLGNPTAAWPHLFIALHMGSIWIRERLASQTSENFVNSASPGGGGSWCRPPACRAGAALCAGPRRQLTCGSAWIHLHRPTGQAVPAEPLAESLALSAAQGVGLGSASGSGAPPSWRDGKQPWEQDKAEDTPQAGQTCPRPAVFRSFPGSLETPRGASRPYRQVWT